MPIYPYRCEACGEVTEVWAKMSDPPPEACPSCGQGPLRKAVARTAFHLKGGGWYAQGYGSSGSSSGGSSSAGGSSDSGGSSDAGGSSDSGGSSDAGSSSSASADA